MYCRFMKIVLPSETKFHLKDSFMPLRRIETYCLLAYKSQQ